MADPDSLADVEDLEREDDLDNLGFFVASVAYDAYKAKTGLTDFSERMGVLSPPPMNNENGWDGNQGSLKGIVPRLCARFGAKP